MLVAMIYCTILTMDLCALDSDTQSSELLVSIAVDQPMLLRKHTDGSREYRIRPMIEIEYRPAVWPADGRRPYISFPVSLIGDRLSLTHENYQSLEITDQDGAEVPCYVPERVVSNAKLELLPRTKISCEFADGFGVTISRTGVLRLSVTILVRDMAGRLIESKVNTTVHIDEPSPK